MGPVSRVEGDQPSIGFVGQAWSFVLPTLTGFRFFRKEVCALGRFILDMFVESERIEKSLDQKFCTVYES